jgi:hypothetical protein
LDIFFAVWRGRVRADIKPSLIGSMATPTQITSDEINRRTENVQGSVHLKGSLILVARRTSNLMVSRFSYSTGSPFLIAARYFQFLAAESNN